MKKTRKTVILISVLICILIPSHILAEEQQASGLISMTGVGLGDKGYFIVEGRPGDKASVTINLKNVSNSYSASSLLFVSDATVAAGGGMGSVPPEQATHHDVGAWFRAMKQDIFLKPGENRDITLHYEIPDNATPGEHVGQIVLYKFISTVPSHKKFNDNESHLYINKAYSQAIAVLVRIPGPVTHNMTLTALKSEWVGSRAFLSLTVANNGNMIEQSSGSITISQKGKVIYTQKGELSSIYPLTSGVFFFPVPENVKVLGTYTADVEWIYGDHVARKAFTFTIASEDIKNAERIRIADQAAKQGRSLSKNAIILTPVLLFKIGGIAAIFIVIVILNVLRLRRVLANCSVKSTH